MQGQQDVAVRYLLSLLDGMAQQPQRAYLQCLAAKWLSRTRCGGGVAAQHTCLAACRERRFEGQGKVGKDGARLPFLLKKRGALD